MVVLSTIWRWFFFKRDPRVMHNSSTSTKLLPFFCRSWFYSYDDEYIRTSGNSSAPSYSNPSLLSSPQLAREQYLFARMKPCQKFHKSLTGGYTGSFTSLRSLGSLRLICLYYVLLHPVLPLVFIIRQLYGLCAFVDFVLFFSSHSK